VTAPHTPNKRILNDQTRLHLLGWAALVIGGLAHYGFPKGCMSSRATGNTSSRSTRQPEAPAGVLTEPNQVRPPPDGHALAFRLAWPSRLEVQAITRCSFNKGPPAILEWHGSLASTPDGSARFELGSVHAEPLPEGNDELLLAKLQVFQDVLPSLELAPSGALRSTLSSDDEAERIRAALLAAFPASFPVETSRARLTKAVTAAALNAHAQAWVASLFLPLVGKTLGTGPDDLQTADGVDQLSGVGYHSELRVVGKTRCYLGAVTQQCAYVQQRFAATDQSRSVGLVFVTELERLLPHWQTTTTTTVSLPAPSQSTEPRPAATSVISTEFRYEQRELERSAP